MRYLLVSELREGGKVAPPSGDSNWAKQLAATPEQCIMEGGHMFFQDPEAPDMLQW